MANDQNIGIEHFDIFSSELVLLMEIPYEEPYSLSV